VTKLSLSGIKLPKNKFNEYLLKAINSEKYELLYIVKHLLYVRPPREHPRPSEAVIQSAIYFCKDNLTFCKAVLKYFNKGIYPSDRDYYFVRQALEVKKFLIPRLEEMLYVKELLVIVTIYLERNEEDQSKQIEMVRQEELIVEYSHVFDRTQYIKRCRRLKNHLNAILSEGRYVGKQSQMIIKDLSHVIAVRDTLTNSLVLDGKKKDVVWFRLDIEHQPSHVQNSLRKEVLKVCDAYMELMKPIPELVPLARFQIPFVLSMKYMINIELERRRLKRVIAKLSEHYKKNKDNLHNTFILVSKYEASFFKKPTEKNLAIIRKYIYQRMDKPEGLTEKQRQSLIICSAKVNKHYNILRAKKDKTKRTLDL
jgi:hypothetical protein